MTQSGKNKVAHGNGVDFLHQIRAVAICGLMMISTFPGVVRAAVAKTVVANAETGAVKIDNFTFFPATLTVAPGTTVSWTNDDDIPHTVVAKDKGFRSKPLDTGNQFTFTFATPGEYAYFCSLHPHMVGKIIVKAADTGGATH
jgi:plastocyanin